MRGIAIASALALLGAAREARAESEGEVALDLAWDAPSACGSVDSFLDKVRHRAPHVRAARDGEAAERVAVRITAQGTAFGGTLSVVDGGERSFRGARCDDVASAIAVAVALHAVAPAAPPPAATPSVATASASTSTESAETGDRPITPTASRPPSVEHAILVGFAPRSGVAPSAALGVDATYSLEPTKLPFVVRFGVGYASGTSARLVLSHISGNTEVCPYRFGSPTGTWWIAPCGRIEGGWHRAEARNQGGTNGIPALGIGPSVLARLPAPSVFVLELEGGFVMPLTQPTFYSKSDWDRRTEYTAPEVAFFGRLAFGVRFP